MRARLQLPACLHRLFDYLLITLSCWAAKLLGATSSFDIFDWLQQYCKADFLGLNLFWHFFAISSTHLWQLAVAPIHAYLYYVHIYVYTLPLPYLMSVHFHWFVYGFFIRTHLLASLRSLRKFLKLEIIEIVFLLNASHAPHTSADPLPHARRALNIAI